MFVVVVKVLWFVMKNEGIFKIAISKKKLFIY